MADPPRPPAASPDGLPGFPDTAPLPSADAGARSAAAQASTPESFERALGELEEIVQRMESGALSLEESLGAYRRGASLVAFCRKSLTEVQQQVRILEADLLRPFDAQPGEPDTPDGRR